MNKIPSLPLTLFHHSYKQSDVREECTTRKAEFYSLKRAHVKRKITECFASTRDSVLKCFSLKYETEFACVVTDELKSAHHDYITFNPTIQLNSLNKSSRFTLVLRQVFYLCVVQDLFLPLFAVRKLSV